MCYLCPRTVLLPFSPDRTIWMSNTSLQRLCLIVSFLLLVPGVAAADGLFTLFAGATVLSSDVTSQSHTSVSYGGVRIAAAADAFMAS
jgi:ABC-type uncharacterized transport system YnjBCD permease subunit